MEINKKIPKSKINILDFQKRHHVKNIGKKILFCLPPNIGLGDAIEYASALKLVSESNIFEKLAVAFAGEFAFLFKDYFNLTNNFPYIIDYVDIKKFDTIFHLTLEIQSLINQKYSRSDIYSEIVSFLKLNILKLKIFKRSKIVKSKKYHFFLSPILPLEQCQLKN